MLSGQDQSDVSGDRSVCISVSKSPQASFFRITAANLAWKQAGKRLWGISCQYRDAQLMQLSSVYVWFAFEKSTTQYKIFCIFKNSESFTSLKKLPSLRENQFSAIFFNVVVHWLFEGQSGQENAGWGAGTGTSSRAISGLNQPSGSLVQLEQRGCDVGRASHMIKEGSAWLRCWSCEWNKAAASGTTFYWWRWDTRVGWGGI